MKKTLFAFGFLALLVVAVRYADESGLASRLFGLKRLDNAELNRIIPNAKITIDMASALRRFGGPEASARLSNDMLNKPLSFQRDGRITRESEKTASFAIPQNRFYKITADTLSTYDPSPMISFSELPKRKELSIAEAGKLYDDSTAHKVYVLRDSFGNYTFENTGLSCRAFIYTDHIAKKLRQYIDINLPVAAPCAFSVTIK